MNVKKYIQSIAHRYYKKFEIKDHHLLYLFLEITRKCNLNCLHCGSDCITDNASPELSTESWLKIIDYFCDRYSPELTFVITGGEPLVHKNLLRIVKKIQERKHRWGMVSNGLLLTQEKFDALIDAGLYSITLSIDGKEISHNKLRNSSISYKKVLQAIEIVGQSNLKYKDAVTCVYPDNLNELDDIAEILINKGITSWRLFRIFPSGRAFNNSIVQLTFQQTQLMLDWIKSNKPIYAGKGLNINLSCEGWIPFDIDKQLRDEPFFCRAGVNIASVLVDGNITGCSNNDKSFYRGNILNEDFSLVWENKFKDFRNRDWLKDTVCNTCQYLKLCIGGSVHLWNFGDSQPKFCYAQEILKSNKSK
jgi:radical SAM protein with 4Fe4S-binding SPASM domain